MKNMILNKFLRILITSFISGLIFGAFSLTYLLTGNILISSCLLAGAYLISLLYAYDNYMIKFAFVLDNKVPYLVETLISILGNFIGAMVIGLIARATPLLDNIDNANNLIISLNHFEVLFYAFISGLLIYFGVNVYKKAEQPIARFLVLILCIVGANLFGPFQFSFDVTYAFLGLNGSVFARLFTILLGNTLGLIVIPSLRKLRGKLN